MKTFKFYLKENNFNIKNPEVGFYPLSDISQLSPGDLVRIPDGLGKIDKIINSKIDDGVKLHITIVYPIHKNVQKGERYEYRFQDITVLGQKMSGRKIKKTLGQILDKDQRKTGEKTTIF